MRNISVSLCPTSLEFSNGDLIDSGEIIEQMTAYLKREYPGNRNRVDVQIGYQQGDEWYKINGNHDDDLKRAVEDFDWTDEGLYTEKENNQDGKEITCI